MSEENQNIENKDNQKCRCNIRKIFRNKKYLFVFLFIIFVFIFFILTKNELVIRGFLPCTHNTFVKGPDMNYLHNGSYVVLDNGNIFVIGGPTKYAEINE